MPCVLPNGSIVPYETRRFAKTGSGQSITKGNPKKSMAFHTGEEPIVTGGVEFRPIWRRPAASDTARQTATDTSSSASSHASGLNHNVLVAEIPAGLLPPGVVISELLAGGRRMVTARYLT
jgi:hypothetical protein